MKRRRWRRRRRRALAGLTYVAVLAALSAPAWLPPGQTAVPAGIERPAPAPRIAVGTLHRAPALPAGLPAESTGPSVTPTRTSPASTDPSPSSTGTEEPAKRILDFEE